METTRFGKQDMLTEFSNPEVTQPITDVPETTAGLSTHFASVVVWLLISSIKMENRIVFDIYLVLV